MQIDLDEDRRRRMVTRLKGFFLESFDEEISEFRAEQLLDFVLTDLAPQVYNQAVQDARAFMQTRLDDLDGEVYLPDPG
ncbi:MAG: DUF2164 domain-containing protein [Gemmatimonadota bacterium]|nr:DUF2164 domain-containing protein [Gemmatimonadota bacterium]